MKYYALRCFYRAVCRANLGDSLQTLASVKTLRALGIDARDIGYLDGEELALERKREKGVVIVQGWFGCRPQTNPLPITDANLAPVYFGFHLNEGSWEFLARQSAFRESLRECEPIGCRDHGTRDFVRSLGVKAYTSGCLTMCFEQRSVAPDRERLFVIDVVDGVEEWIPPARRGQLVRLSQELDIPSGRSPATEEDLERLESLADERLKRLKAEATLVVTKRLHVALPCLAMGIRVVFCFEETNHPRVSLLKDLLPIYDRERFNEIDWNPRPVEMRERKGQMQLMFAYRLEVAERRLGKTEERLGEQDREKAERLLKEACECEEPVRRFGADSYAREDFLARLFNGGQRRKLERGASLVLFGAGSAGRHLRAVLRYFGVSPHCFCDSSARIDGAQYHDGLPVITFRSLQKTHADSLVLVSSMTYFETLKKQLLEGGFKEEQIIGTPSLIRKYSHFVVPGE